MENSTIEPVTVSGWYELRDGRVQEFYWNSGRLKGGEVVASWRDVPTRDYAAEFRKELADRAARKQAVAK
jgi:hypothetical protein